MAAVSKIKFKKLLLSSRVSGSLLAFFVYSSNEGDIKAQSSSSVWIELIIL